MKQDYHSPIRMNHTKKLWMQVSYIFIALEIKKYIAYNCMYTVYKYTYIYIMYMQHIYNLEVHMSTIGMVIHNTG